MHKIHRPTAIELVGNDQYLRLFTHQPLLGFDPHVQFKLPINPVDTLVIPAKPFDVAQVEKTEAKAPVPLGTGDAQQPVRDKLVFIGKHGLIAITAFADLEDVAG